jgi:hypothetical protein
MRLASRFSSSEPIFIVTQYCNFGENETAIVNIIISMTHGIEIWIIMPSNPSIDPLSLDG